MRLSLRMLILLSAVSSIILSMYAFEEGSRITEDLSVDAVKRHKSVVANSMAPLAQGLWTFDDVIIDAGLRSLFETGDFVDIALVGKSGNLVARLRLDSRGALEKERSLPTLSFDPGTPQGAFSDKRLAMIGKEEPLKDNQLRFSAPLYIKNGESPPEFLGHLIAVFSNQEAIDRTKEFIVRLAVVCIILSVAISLVSALFLQRLVAKPIGLLARASIDLQNAKFTRVPAPEGNDEISDLSRNFNHMVDRLRRNLEILVNVGAVSQRIGSVTVLEELSAIVANVGADVLGQSYPGLKTGLIFSREFLISVECSDVADSEYQTIGKVPSAVALPVPDCATQYRSAANPILVPVAGNAADKTPQAFLAIAGGHELPIEALSALVPIATSIESCFKNISHGVAQKRVGIQESELAAVAVVQDALLPVQFQGEKIESAAYFQSAERAGGDWYGHYFEESRRVHYFFIGDITGHGIPSAILAGVLCGAVYSGEQRADLVAHNVVTEPSDRLVEMATVANRVLFDTGSRSNRCATMLFVGLEIDTGRIHYLSAAHTPAVVVSFSKGARFLRALGTRLGVESSASFQVSSDTLAPGDTLFLFTDGLFENHAKNQTPLGMNKLKKVLNLASQTPMSPSALVDSIVKIVQPLWGEDPLEDDVTILAVQWTPGEVAG